MRRALVVLAVLAAVLFPSEKALAAPHTFDGQCVIPAVVNATYTSTDVHVEGSGTCTGLLDGAPVQSTPVTLNTTGEALAFFGPVIGHGSGTLSFTEAEVTFPIAYQTLGLALRVYTSCLGCAGGALGTFAPTPPNPAATDDGPRTAITIAVQTNVTMSTP